MYQVGKNPLKYGGSIVLPRMFCNKNRCMDGSFTISSCNVGKEMGDNKCASSLNLDIDKMLWGKVQMLKH